ncbi:hypothetical protein ABZ746_39245 [Streptomyces sp. NPDC020096]
MTAPDPTVQAMIEGRRADTGRRRQRVLAALAQAAKDGSEISFVSIARRAGVDRTFLYRHRDLLGQVHAQAAEPPTIPGGRGPAVSRASLQADLLAADARTARLAAQVPPPRSATQRGPGRAGLARIRHRRPRGHRTAQGPDHHLRTAGDRPGTRDPGA